jgi:hypothetical protein
VLPRNSGNHSVESQVRRSPRQPTPPPGIPLARRVCDVLSTAADLSPIRCGNALETPGVAEEAEDGRHAANMDPGACRPRLAAADLGLWTQSFLGCRLVVRVPFFWGVYS